jgi:hypothetical protein
MVETILLATSRFLVVAALFGAARLLVVFER